MDIFVRVFRLQVQELGDHQVGIGVVDRYANEKDSVLQEAGEDVVGPLTPTGLLDHHWNEEHARTPSGQARVTRLTPSPTFARWYRKSRAFRSSSRRRIPSRRPSRPSDSGASKGCPASNLSRIWSFRRPACSRSLWASRSVLTFSLKLGTVSHSPADLAKSLSRAGTRFFFTSLTTTLKRGRFPPSSRRGWSAGNSMGNSFTSPFFRP